MNVKLLIYFLAKIDKTAKELWDAVKQRYHKENKDQMITLGNQLVILRVSHGLNIMEQITDFVSLQKQFVSLENNVIEEEFVNHLMTKLP